MGSMNVVDNPGYMQGPRPWLGAWPLLLSVCLSCQGMTLVGWWGPDGGREEAGVWEDSESRKLFTVFRHHL